MKRTLAGYGAVCVTVGAAFAALGPVMWLHTWLAAAAWGSLAVIVALAGGSMLAPRVGPWVAGPLVAVAAASALYAPERAWGVIIPTPMSVIDLGSVVRSGARQAYLAVPPAGALGYVPAFLGCGAILTTLVVGLLAVRLRLPLVAALVALGWWVVPVGRGFSVPGWVCAAFVVGICGMVWVTPARGLPAQKGDRVGRLSALAAIAGGLIVAVALAGPLSTLTGVARPGAPMGGVRVEQARVELSQSADLLTDLLAPRSQVVMSRSGSGDGAPLRVYVSQEFDGSSWVPMPEPSDTVAVAPSDVTGEVGAPTDGAPKEVRITLHALSGTDLPLIISQRSVNSNVGLQYSASRDLLRAGRAADGMWVDFTYSQRDLSAENLDAAQPAAPDGSSDPLLQVPETEHGADIAALAQEVTANQTTAYRKLVALQDYLRQFTYSLVAPPQTSGDAVWDFLQAKQGYCVHSATAFIIMARDLGIPTRLAIGYLPGAGTAADILSTDAHAWPEVFFDGYGWVSFEPTPPSRTGAVSAVPAVPSDGAPSAAPATATAAPQTATPSASAGATAAPSRAHAPGAVWAWVAVGALALLGAAAVVAWRRRASDVDSTALGTWRTLRREAARAGITWQDSTTARSAAAQLLPALDSPGRQALRDLVAIVEHELYDVPTLPSRGAHDALDIIVQELRRMAKAGQSPTPKR